MSDEFRGSAGVRAQVAEFYRAWLPAHAAACAAAWGLEPGQLVVPVSDPADPTKDAYFPREPTALDRWPLLAVTSGRSTVRETDHTDLGEMVIRTVHPVRVYTWVRDEGLDTTQTMRDLLAASVVVTSLAHLNFGGTGELVLVPGSLVTDFSGVEKVKGDRWVAGSYVGFDVHATETLTDRLTMPGQQPRDTVGVVTVTATVQPEDS